MCQTRPAICFQAFRAMPMDLAFIEHTMISMTILNVRLTEMVSITITALYWSPIRFFERLESKARATGIYPQDMVMGTIVHLLA